MSRDKRTVVRSDSPIKVLTWNFSRPANATAYASGAVIQDTTNYSYSQPAFEVTPEPGGVVKVLSAKLWTQNKNYRPSVGYGLWLFNARPEQNSSDGDTLTLNNAAEERTVTAPFITLNITDHDSALRLGSAFGRWFHNDRVDAYFLCADDDTRMWPQLQVEGTMTPLSSQDFYVTLILEQVT